MLDDAQDALRALRVGASRSKHGRHRGDRDKKCGVEKTWVQHGVLQDRRPVRRKDSPGRMASEHDSEASAITQWVAQWIGAAKLRNGRARNQRKRITMSGRSGGSRRRALRWPPRHRGTRLRENARR